MPDVYTTLSSQLNALQQELGRHGLWSEHPPPASALASTAPFCHDTMAFHTWLQWLFIPRVRQLVAHRAPLPGGCNIAPMAEISYAETPWDHSDLMELLRQIDLSFHQGAGMLQ